MRQRDNILKTFNKILHRVRTGTWPGLAVLAPIALAGCVSSSEPILTDGKAILGERGQIHVFSAPRDGVRDVLRMQFHWNGSRYVAGRGSGASDFTVHPFEGRDLIVQRTPALIAQRTPSPVPRRTQYGLARKLNDGVYLLIPISEEDVDETTRARFCTRTQDVPCRISTPEQLFVFARATAAKEEDSGGIAIVVAERPPQQRHRR
jgi:hypothetical protein